MYINIKKGKKMKKEISKKEASSKTKKSNSIIQVAKLTGVSTSLLRKYEREGLLNPKRKEENHYREYDAENISRILGIRQFRKLGIPLKEIEELLSGNNLQKNLISLQKYRSELLERIQREKEISYYLSHLIDMLENHDKRVTYRVLPPQFYIEYNLDDAFIADKEKIKLITWMLNENTCTYLAALLPEDILSAQPQEEYLRHWILASPDTSLLFQEDHRFEHLPGGTYAYCTISGNEESLYDALKTAQAEITEDGFQISGRIMMEKNASKDLYTLYIPVCKI